MADNTPDMSQLLGKLMSDEKFNELVKSVKTSISADVEDATSALPETSAETESVPSSDVSMPTLSPELISRLPEIMGMLSDSGGKQGSSRIEDRKRLLNAMKPFLSEKRRSAVDSIVNIAGIADLFGI